MCARSRPDSLFPSHRSLKRSLHSRERRKLRQRRKQKRKPYHQKLSVLGKPSRFFSGKSRSKSRYSKRTSSLKSLKRSLAKKRSRPFEIYPKSKKNRFASKEKGNIRKADRSKATRGCN